MKNWWVDGWHYIWRRELLLNHHATISCHPHSSQRCNTSKYVSSIFLLAWLIDAPTKVTPKWLLTPEPITQDKRTYHHLQIVWFVHSGDDWLCGRHDHRCWNCQKTINSNCFFFLTSLRLNIHTSKRNLSMNKREIVCSIRQLRSYGLLG